MNKKLFLITTLSLLSSLSAFGGDNLSDQTLLNFATNLKNLPNAEYKETAQWMEKTFVAVDEYHQNMTAFLINIINGNISVQQKIDAIIKLKKAEEQKYAQQNNVQKRSSFLSSMAKVTGAVIAVAGVVYYLYTAQPWKK